MINFFKSFPLIQYKYVDDVTSITSIDINRNIKAYIEELDNANAYLLYDIKNGDRPDQVSMELYKTPIYFWTFFLLNEHLLNGLHGWPKTAVELDNYITQHYNRTVITNISKTGQIGTNHLIQGVIDPNQSDWQTENGAIKIFATGQVVTGSVSGATATIDEVDYEMNRLYLTNVVGTLQDETITVTTATGIDLSVATNPNMTLQLKSMISSAAYTVVVEDEKNATHHYLDSDDMKVQRTNFNADDDVYEVTNYEYETELNDTKAQIRVLNPTMVHEFATQYKKLINA